MTVVGKVEFGPRLDDSQIDKLGESEIDKLNRAIADLRAAVEELQDAVFVYEESSNPLEDTHRRFVARIRANEGDA